MIAVDTNILVYAHKQDSPFHEESKRAIAGLTEAAGNWAIPWACLHEFYAVVTNPRLFTPASTPVQALAQIQEWLRAPTIRVLAESREHLPRLADLVASVGVRGAGVYDAKIAAICLSHGVSELLTMDHDFSRYPELKTRSLLA
jgi:uncharacterized protein